MPQHEEARQRRRWAREEAEKAARYALRARRAGDSEQRDYWQGLAYFARENCARHLDEARALESST